MPVTFMKPDGKNFTVDFCDKNLNLLAHAQAIELDIGSRCGGHGVCGGDRVRILPASPGVPPAVSAVSEEETRHLSSEELAEGWRLACQCFPERTGDRLSLEARA